MRKSAALCLALVCLGSAAQTYRWTDGSGRTIVSDVPPPGKVKVLATPQDTASPQDGLPFATRRAMENFPVILYTSSDCGPPCQQGRDLLAERAIPFTEKSLQNPDEADELKQLIGDPFVPTLKIGRQTSRGFEAGRWNNALDLAGYPSTRLAGKKTAGQNK